ncbi:Uncharacterized protein APZ42_031817 [Daphnia magna]|uniref:Pre-C2HC domain-containing protein n=1 Tax=Daphnia magna TaxID=35525 RepID=A0A164MI62_9CRUS|nr:Uncharacterized protein APZ42_031817 [Daphnia magna]
MDKKPIPVFIKRNGLSTFKKMKSEEISAIIQELEQKLGPFEKGGVSIAAGGDLLIRPTSCEQQNQLLDTHKVLNGEIEVNCSLPNSHTSQRIIIRQAGDTNEEIRQALERYGYKISNVHRFTIHKGTSKIPSTTVAIEFNGQYPKEILLNGLVFIPEKQLPSTLRCKKCQRLGQTERFCNSPHACSICGITHEDTANCKSSPNCINCKGDHPASSPTCPKYLQMRASARAEAEKGTPQQETRLQPYSEIAKNNSTTAPEP